MGISGINHAASAPALLRFAFRVAIHAQGWLPAGWLAFTGRVSNPLDHCEKVSDHMTILLSCSPDATRAAVATTSASRPVYPRQRPTCCNVQVGTVGPEREITHSSARNGLR